MHTNLRVLNIIMECSVWRQLDAAVSNTRRLLRPDVP